MFLSSFRNVTDPLTNCLKHNVLTLHIEFIMVKDVTEFLHRQLKELLAGNNFFKVTQDDLECLLLQLGAVVGVTELPEGKAVVSGERLHQEVTASLYNAHYVELVRCEKQLHDITVCHRHSVGVRIRNDEPCHICRKVRDLVDFLVWC